MDIVDAAVKVVLRFIGHSHRLRHSVKAVVVDVSFNRAGICLLHERAVNRIIIGNVTVIGSGVVFLSAAGGHVGGIGRGIL